MALPPADGSLTCVLLVPTGSLPMNRRRRVGFKYLPVAPPTGPSMDPGLSPRLPSALPITLNGDGRLKMFDVGDNGKKFHSFFPRG